MNVRVKEAQNPRKGVRIYGVVETGRGEYDVAYIRKPGMKRWVCTCRGFLYDHMPSRTHCDHIKEAIKVRNAEVTGEKLNDPLVQDTIDAFARGVVTTRHTKTHTARA